MKKFQSLSLTRRKGEALLIGDNVRITITALQSGHAQLRIEAPADVLVLRLELATLEQVSVFPPAAQ